MTDVSLSPNRPPETVLPAPDDQIISRLDAAAVDAEPLMAVASVLADDPRFLHAWAAAGELAERLGPDHRIEAYAYFRVGYHRGLDQLRANGWRGSGYVRWQYPENQGFLRCLDGLRRVSTAIGELDEAVRCAEFLTQLDPRWEG
jgi:hypothetical protein